MATLFAIDIQEKLQSRRPNGCLDSIWNKFLDFFPKLCKTGFGSEFPDIIHWCNISGEESLEISYIHQEITFYIDHYSCEMCDQKTGRWYFQNEIESHWKND